MEEKSYTISELRNTTGVSNNKINRCVDTGLLSEGVHFERQENGYRRFKEAAERTLKLYNALDSLSLRLTHHECCAAIKLFTLPTLESHMQQGTLSQSVFDKLKQIRSRR